MGAEIGHDGARFLSGSPARAAILRALRDDPRRPAALTDAVDATRTTVQRILAGFRERDWVVKRGSAYHVTATGERVHDAYEDLLSEIERADRYGRFAADLERVGAGFPPSALTEGELTVADDRDPLAAVDRVVEVIRGGTGESIRSISPIVTRQYNEAAAEALDRGARIRLIIDREVLDASVEDFGPATDRALVDENASVLIATEPIGFGLFRDEETACVIAHDERNNPRCVFESSDPAVLDWADERFDELSATAVELSDAVGD
ncbi:transcriptional regulator [Halorubrum sp. JWXQ-INN 858]|uniref:helix-turn-helix transcriptional regulator n=1 Tax=Halorubrum sp. JWXQ-INN 858 TaxID=2690782 RepID=UPI00135733DA|nr:transcriptional regulator [Halorubrum sp. JWXQ-INN 858]MWV63405.1 transcriptional regulator [Halorubrum sp. JWXQ-INN 858]